MTILFINHISKPLLSSISRIFFYSVSKYFFCSWSSYNSWDISQPNITCNNEI